MPGHGVLRWSSSAFPGSFDSRAIRHTYANHSNPTRRCGSFDVTDRAQNEILSRNDFPRLQSPPEVSQPIGFAFLHARCRHHTRRSPPPQMCLPMICRSGGMLLLFSNRTHLHVFLCLSLMIVARRLLTNMQGPDSSITSNSKLVSFPTQAYLSLVVLR
ncbi:hypothetical protein BDY21DRAFT_178018 [Lineolata rhizophorae]|uniref:Uncharacterized protein n=1 Tax=Lineolata rhizophorae TaxID=578093 RepID=A0A6A6P8K2_9PEZI|nr:hypothetical protein BDY21DRAFT_178018 [Lineolata rhizophorae]